MEKKCSSKEHQEIKAKFYCQICKIYMCNKCESIHQKLFSNHSPYNLNENINEIFTGICKEENHLNSLDYFCKNHNVLCCAACISKIKGKGNGQHADCEICFIEDIKDTKKNKLKDNIKLLEDLSNTLNQSIINLKNILEKNEKDKEQLKSNIQNIFTKLRSALNDREDELLLEVDKNFDNIFSNKNFDKEGENLPKKVNKYLEKGKLIDKDWKDDNLKLMINDCINIENNIEYINKINKDMNDYNSKMTKIKFIPENENQIDEFIKSIKNFGNLSIINEDDKWIISDILEKPEDKSKLKLWINKNKEFNTKLLYKLSRDGETINKFHELCDNIKDNLILIRATNKTIFGSYCTWVWNNTGNKLNNINDGFLFNLTKDKKYENNNQAIHQGCSNHGPYIYNKFYFDKTMKKCYIASNQFLEKIGTNDVEEVEIFQILI